jgi:small-conductance mechanosensitive channel
LKVKEKSPFAKILFTKKSTLQNLLDEIFFLGCEKQFNLKDWVNVLPCTFRLTAQLGKHRPLVLLPKRKTGIVYFQSANFPRSKSELETFNFFRKKFYI